MKKNLKMAMVGLTLAMSMLVMTSCGGTDTDEPQATEQTEDTATPSEEVPAEETPAEETPAEEGTVYETDNEVLTYDDSYTFTDMGELQGGKTVSFLSANGTDNLIYQTYMDAPAPAADIIEATKVQLEAVEGYEFVGEETIVVDGVEGQKVISKMTVDGQTVYQSIYGVGNGDNVVVAIASAATEEGLAPLEDLVTGVKFK